MRVIPLETVLKLIRRGEGVESRSSKRPTPSLGDQLPAPDELRGLLQDSFECRCTPAGDVDSDTTTVSGNERREIEACLEIGLRYAREDLAGRDARLGRTCGLYRRHAERVEADIERLVRALDTLNSSS